MRDENPWKKLTRQQLIGAYAALRLVHSSPAIVGRGLEVVKSLTVEVSAEVNRRTKHIKVKKKVK